MVYIKNGEAATWLTKFKLDNSSILFTTSQDDVLHAAARGYVVAFETNAIDNRQRLRWTITVVGHLSLASSNEVPAVTSQLSQSILPPGTVDPAGDRRHSSEHRSLVTTGKDRAGLQTVEAKPVHRADDIAHHRRAARPRRHPPATREQCDEHNHPSKRSDQLTNA